MRYRNLLWVLSLGFLILTVFDCASTRPPKVDNLEEFVWPLPPDPPRIRYVKSIHSEMDVGRNRSLAQRISESLFGRPILKALKKPLGVHVDKQGRVLVVDTGWRKVLIFDFENNQLKILGQAGKGLLLNPLGVTTDNKGRIYVTDADGHRVMVYNSEGTFLKAFGGKDKLLRPSGIAVNSNLGLVYVVDTWAHQIKVFGRKSGNLLFTIGKKGERPHKALEGAMDQTWNRGSDDAEFRFPTQIAIDSDGYLYIVDTLNFRVQILEPNGTIITKFGQVGNLPGSFFRPKGIALDSDGHIYVADASFNNVQIFDKQGNLLLYFGNFGSGPANLRLPAGMFIDQKNQIYIVDQLNNRIQVYQYLGHGPEEKPYITEKERR